MASKKKSKKKNPAKVSSNPGKIKSDQAKPEKESITAETEATIDGLKADSTKSDQTNSDDSDQNESDETEDAEKPEKKSLSAKLRLHKEKKLKKRRAKYERALEKDIHYRGPLSYRYLRIIAWMIICQFPITILYKIRAAIDPSMKPSYISAKADWEAYQDFIVPLFLLANFAVILDKKISFKNLIKKYLVLAVTVYASLAFFYLRYVKGTAAAAVNLLGISSETITKKINNLGSQGYLTFNVFIDLLLCTLFMFFLNYKPKRVFTGSRLKYFRLLSILPVAYEVFCITLRILAFEGKVTIPVLFYPLMTTKPPIMLIFFVLLVINIKYGENRFLKTGLSHKQYVLYQKTKKNSLYFSLHACSLCLVCTVLDIIMSSMIVLLLLLNKSDGNFDSIDNNLIYNCYAIVEKWGFFAYEKLLNMLIPLLLFSYSKQHKNAQFDVALPFIAIAVILLIIIEGLYQGSLEMMKTGVKNIMPDLMSIILE